MRRLTIDLPADLIEYAPETYDPTRRLASSVSVTMRDAVRQVAEELQVSESTIVRQALWDWWEP